MATDGPEVRVIAARALEMMLGDDIDKVGWPACGFGRSDAGWSACGFGWSGDLGYPPVARRRSRPLGRAHARPADLRSRSRRCGPLRSLGPASAYWNMGNRVVMA